MCKHNSHSPGQSGISMRGLVLCGMCLRPTPRAEEWNWTEAPPLNLNGGNEDMRDY